MPCMKVDLEVLLKGKLTAAPSVKDHMLADKKEAVVNKIGSVKDSILGQVLLLIDTSGCEMNESVDKEANSESKYNVG